MHEIIQAKQHHRAKHWCQQSTTPSTKSGKELKVPSDNIAADKRSGF